METKFAIGPARNAIEWIHGWGRLSTVYSPEETSPQITTFMAIFLGLSFRPNRWFVISFDGATWKEECFGHVRQNYIVPNSEFLKKEMPLLPVMSAWLSVLWTKFIGASVLMGNIWRVLLVTVSPIMAIISPSIHITLNKFYLTLFD